VTTSRDAEFADYVAARMLSLRRVAFLLCQDWHRADDLVQSAITKLYVHWAKASAADNIDAYVRAIVVREFLHERRTTWATRVSLPGQVPESPVAADDRDASLDLQAAVAGLPPRQRATLVVRFYLDLNVDQSAQVLGCSAGTVKSQTARALRTLRDTLTPPGEPAADGIAARPQQAADTGSEPTHA
jgi:RNA polymerase sigma-70 factor (sigma-E family)